MLGRICSNVSSFCGNAINRVPQAVRQTVHETAVEAATVGFSAVAAKISAVTFMSSFVANGFGAVAGSFYGTESVRDPSRRISQSRFAARLLGSTMIAGVSAAACFRSFEWKKMNYAKGLFVLSSFFTTAQLTAGAVQTDGIRPGARVEEVDLIERKRALEWGAGAAVGSCVAGYVAAPMGLGIGCGIAAGVVAMKATRVVARAIANRVI